MAAGKATRMRTHAHREETRERPYNQRLPKLSSLATSALSTWHIAVSDCVGLCSQLRNASRPTCFLWSCAALYQQRTSPPEARLVCQIQPAALLSHSRSVSTGHLLIATLPRVDGNDNFRHSCPSTHIQVFQRRARHLHQSMVTASTAVTQSGLATPRDLDQSEEMIRSLESSTRQYLSAQP